MRIRCVKLQEVGECGGSGELQKVGDGGGDVCQGLHGFVEKEVWPGLVVHDGIGAQELARSVPDGDFYEGGHVWRTEDMAELVVWAEGAHVSYNASRRVGDKVVRLDGVLGSAVIEDGNRGRACSISSVQYMVGGIE